MQGTHRTVPSADRYQYIVRHTFIELVDSCSPRGWQSSPRERAHSEPPLSDSRESSDTEANEDLQQDALGTSEFKVAGLTAPRYVEFDLEDLSDDIEPFGTDDSQNSPSGGSCDVGGVPYDSMRLGAKSNFLQAYNDVPVESAPLWVREGEMCVPWMQGIVAVQPQVAPGIWHHSAGQEVCHLIACATNLSPWSCSWEFDGSARAASAQQGKRVKAAIGKSQQQQQRRRQRQQQQQQQRWWWR